MLNVENVGEIILEILKRPGTYLDKMPTLFSTSEDLRRCNQEVKRSRRFVDILRPILVQHTTTLNEAIKKQDAAVLAQAEAFVEEVVNE